MLILRIIIIFVIVFCIEVLRNPSILGYTSEQSIAFKLKFYRLIKNNGHILSNIYIPKQSGDTTEIDVLYISRKGLIVIENKDYAGYIFGNDLNKNWTVTLYAGKDWLGRKTVEKHTFYNPVWQNRNHKEIYSVLNRIWRTKPDVLTNAEIDKIYQTLLPLTLTPNYVREKHIEDIQHRFNSTDICPVCGGKLILRVAKKGPNAGKTFYGCSNYPRCRYKKDENV